MLRIRKRPSSDNTVNRYRTDSIGVQVSMPIYSGGGVSASTRQAAARYGQAMCRWMRRRAPRSTICASSTPSISSRAKVAAYELAVQSATTQ